MKKDQLQKLKEKTREELAQELKVNQDKLWQLRQEVINGKLKKVSEIQKLKVLVAVIKTISNEKRQKS